MENNVFKEWALTMSWVVIKYKLRWVVEKVSWSNPKMSVSINIQKFMLQGQCCFEEWGIVEHLAIAV
jgi:hypothetical protein